MGVAVKHPGQSAMVTTTAATAARYPAHVMSCSSAGSGTQVRDPLPPPPPRVDGSVSSELSSQATQSCGAG